MREKRTEGKRRVRGKGLPSPLPFLSLLFLFLLLFLPSFLSFADEIELNVTYGYQNTAKAGRFLPLKIGIRNSGSETFSGMIHIYMAESGSSICEYQYPSAVEAESDTELSMAVALSSGVNQLLVTATNQEGRLVGSRRVGLDVASSDAELIIGVLSEQEDKLSYLNSVSINDGLLRTREVALDQEKLPSSETELDQLDVLLLSDFPLSRMNETEVEVINRWVERGGVLILGTGARGEDAVSPYYRELLREPLSPRERSIDMREGLERSSAQEEPLRLVASPVSLRSGREGILYGGVSYLSVVSRGAGLIAVSGYDFCDLQRFATEESGYVNQLFTKILGESRLNALSVSASERSLNRYWSMEALMNQSDLSKRPNAGLYLLLLLAYLLILGPLIYYYVKLRDAIRLYRPLISITAVFFSFVIWAVGVGTRFNGSFLSYARIRDISRSSVDETDYINLRSPYEKMRELRVKTEYFVYPILKGSDYTGDITELRDETELARTAIRYGRDRTEISIRNEAPFSPKYFELDNKFPNSGGFFGGEVNLFDGSLGGSITNGTDYTLYDAAVLLYGKLILIGKLEKGEKISLRGRETETVPVGDYEWIASRITGGSRRALLSYYLSNSLSGFFSNARLIGFVREEEVSFLERQKLESFGSSMVTAALPLNTSFGNYDHYSALSRDPEVKSGDYERASNTISAIQPAKLAYHLGEEEQVWGISFEALSVSKEGEERLNEKPFRGSISLYNYRTGGYDPLRSGSLKLQGEELSPYLSEENVLVVLYSPKEENGSLLMRQYLPMITVVAKEKSSKGKSEGDKESGAEASYSAESAPEEESASLPEGESAESSSASENEERGEEGGGESAASEEGESTEHAGGEEGESGSLSEGAESEEAELFFEGSLASSPGGEEGGA